MKIGIIKEYKTPPDKRVVFSPNMCLETKKKFPEIEFFVERSDIFLAILFITFIIAEAVININNYVSTSDGQIQDSIELQGPYGIVFTSLIFFLLLGIIRMFIGPDNQMEET